MARDASVNNPGSSPVDRLIYVINGPDLSLLSSPQSEGHETQADVEREVLTSAKTLDLEVAFCQSNLEGGIIDFIHDARAKAAGVVINAGSYAHTSIGIHDALKILAVPIIGVRMANIHPQDELRQHSYISRVASGVIIGCGSQGYVFALQRIARLIANTST